MNSKSHRAESVTEVDIHVGRMIRAVRRAKGVSQEKLAEALGTSFQQVQKYELGLNRVSASKMYLAANFLDVAPGAFFEGLENASTITMPPVMLAFFGEEGAIEVAEGYLKLGPAQRRAVAALIGSMVE